MQPPSSRHRRIQGAAMWADDIINNFAINEPRKLDFVFPL